jgi:hypothetical protein
MRRSLTRVLALLVVVTIGFATVASQLSGNHPASTVDRELVARAPRAAKVGLAAPDDLASRRTQLEAWLAAIGDAEQRAGDRSAKAALARQADAVRRLLASVDAGDPVAAQEAAEAVLTATAAVEGG